MPILVAGATGTVGGSLVRQLVEAGHEVRALTRNPESEAAAALPAGVEVVKGSFLEPQSLVPALRDVERMHLVSIEGSAENWAEMLELAKKAGVRRLTHLGHNDESKDDDHPLEAWHRQVHRAIEGSGLEWTHLFPGEFMANTWQWAESIKGKGEVRSPFGDWNSALVHEADIAAVAMVALLEDGHAGKTYQPTGPEPVRRRDAVRMIGEALGTEIRFVELTPDQARREWADVYPPDIIEWFLEMGTDYEGVGWVSPDVVEVTGRPGRTFAQWTREHAGDFR
ncbi:NmrA family NAD(P)-binding protein [Sinosporangium siamense]|uniref:Nucleotide-diphosphate-sugar epimerase n=1 Tax=Sinosporangium siamense TaxID=1367973 RepID=A0A919V6D1_9ACTN|nr:NmrA family NAD(P)-binding protein [Sinosporangium siamense]GII90842.1 nucleotide-diphosphate-sugar epimerase [Sinosporangium siamense]